MQIDSETRFKMKSILLAFTFTLALWCVRADELQIPAFTAYLEPIDGGALISDSGGIVGWDSPSQKISWFGEIKKPGKLNCSIKLRLSAGAESALRLTVGGISHIP